MTKTIFRKEKNKKNPYVMVSKAAIHDERLSWKDTGLLTYLLSLPDNWNIHINEIINHKIDGEHATRTAIKHLISYGYLEKIVHKDKNNRIVKHEYIIHEEPLCGFPHVDNHALLNTDSNNNIIKPLR